MVASRSRLTQYAIICARMIIPTCLVGELYLHIFIIAPVVYGIGWAYCVYLIFLGFVVVNVIANIVTFVLTDTSILMDSCMEPELNVKLCTMCDRNVPPRYALQFSFLAKSNYTGHIFQVIFTILKYRKVATIPDL